jgi:hypothetical protein
LARNWRRLAGFVIILRPFYYENGCFGGVFTIEMAALGCFYYKNDIFYYENDVFYYESDFFVLKMAVLAVKMAVLRVFLR